ncbi:HNH endonuclease signature motif containing protein [Lacihabitans lacunae]|uniref:HNH endonuclease n=1 Tax=Lacihabitans lacunae TaxID=1028214 RepID=A0ABV7YRT1_9BACT
MIFTYQYIKHDIEKLQEFLDFLFYDVWLVAEGTFNFSKLDKNPDLKNICEKLELEDTKWGNFFNSRIAWIYDEFAKIKDNNFKLDLIDFYHNNNNIEALCSSKTLSPLTYSELEVKYPDLEKAINSFYSKLYGSESPFNLDAFGQLSKKLLQSHYKAFVDSNNDGICPFCGLNSIDGNIVSTKDAYDHFLPKSIYPFNSINFKNLSPMCYKCNSGNKSTNDPIEHIKGRKLAFYPYSIIHPKIEFGFKLLSKNVKALTPKDYILSINCLIKAEEIETWKRVFKIDIRYDELICNKHKAKEWYEDVYDYFENAKALVEIEDAEKYFEKVIKSTTRNPRSVKNTIKRKFLEECKANGLFKNNTM